MNSFTKAVFAFLLLLFLLSGCGVKEGAEFYALQKQDNQLENTVSNLQLEVNGLIAENNGLRAQLATNSQAISYLIQDERQQELENQKLRKQLSKIRSGQ